MDFERGTLETGARGAREGPVRRRARPIRRRKEGELTQALGRLFALAESYPTLTVERERQAAAGGAGVHGEQDRVRPPVLQRHRDEVQHRAADVPGEPRGRAARLQGRRAVRGDRRGRARGAGRGPVAAQVPVRERCRPTSTSSKRRTAAARGASWCCSWRSCSPLATAFDRFYLGMSYPIVGLIALVFGSISAVSSYVRGDRAVLASCKAVPHRPVGARRRDAGDPLQADAADQRRRRDDAGLGAPAPAALSSSTTPTPTPSRPGAIPTGRRSP